MRISDWSSDVCSSDLQIGDVVHLLLARPAEAGDMLVGDHRIAERIVLVILFDDRARERRALLDPEPLRQRAGDDVADHDLDRDDLDLADELDRKSTRLTSSH